MQQGIQWIGSKGAWTCSRGADVPQLPQEPRSEAHHWCVVAGGLALLLSRASDTQRAGRFTATGQLYDLLRQAMHRRQRPGAAAALVADVIHEVAGVADPMTQDSLGACFAECLKRSTVSEDSHWPAFARLIAASRRAASARGASSVRELDDPAAVYSLV